MNVEREVRVLDIIVVDRRDLREISILRRTNSRGSRVERSIAEERCERNCTFFESADHFFRQGVWHRTLDVDRANYGRAIDYRYDRFRTRISKRWQIPRILVYIIYKHCLPLRDRQPR